MRAESNRSKMCAVPSDCQNDCRLDIERAARTSRGPRLHCAELTTVCSGPCGPHHETDQATSPVPASGGGASGVRRRVDSGVARTPLSDHLSSSDKQSRGVINSPQLKTITARRSRAYLTSAHSKHRHTGPCSRFWCALTLSPALFFAPRPKNSINPPLPRNHWDETIDSAQLERDDSPCPPSKPSPPCDRCRTCFDREV
jgi:hypothetical protein